MREVHLEVDNVIALLRSVRTSARASGALWAGRESAQAPANPVLALAGSIPTASRHTSSRRRPAGCAATDTPQPTERRGTGADGRRVAPPSRAASRGLGAGVSVIERCGDQCRPAQGEPVSRSALSAAHHPRTGEAGPPGVDHDERHDREADPAPWLHHVGASSPAVVGFVVLGAPGASAPDGPPATPGGGPAQGVSQLASLRCEPGDTDSYAPDRQASDQTGERSPRHRAEDPRLRARHRPRMTRSA